MTNHEVEVELARARAKFPPFHSAHEGYAVLLEEVRELERAIFWETPARAREEAVQVGAMARRLIEDCYPAAPSSTADEGRSCPTCGRVADEFCLPGECPKGHPIQPHRDPADEGRCADCGIGEWADGPGGADDEPIETHDAGWVASGGHPFQPHREPIEDDYRHSQSEGFVKMPDGTTIRGFGLRITPPEPIEEQEAPAKGSVADSRTYYARQNETAAPEPVEEGWTRTGEVDTGWAYFKRAATWERVDGSALYRVPPEVERAIRAPLEAENARLHDYVLRLSQSLMDADIDPPPPPWRAPDEVQEG